MAADLSIDSTDAQATNTLESIETPLSDEPEHNYILKPETDDGIARMLEYLHSCSQARTLLLLLERWLCETRVITLEKPLLQHLENRVLNAAGDLDVMEGVVYCLSLDVHGTCCF